MFEVAAEIEMGDSRGRRGEWERGLRGKFKARERLVYEHGVHGGRHGGGGRGCGCDCEEEEGEGKCESAEMWSGLTSSKMN